jgi:hypothetical protein
MKTPHAFSLILFFFALLPAACAPVAPAPAGAPPTVPVAVPSPTPTPKPTAVPLSFTPATYKAEAQAFELDYPSDWTAVPISVIGSRGSSGALYSPGTSAETLAEGGSRVGITVYSWDPKGDLATYVTHRKTAWDSGGSSIVKESSGDLVDGRKYMSFVVQAADSQQAFFLLTTLGEQYLEISGEGNLALVEEIAHTVRPLGFKQ